MRLARRAAGVAIALLTLDIWLAIVTGGAWLGSEPPLGPAAFALCLALWAFLFAIRFRWLAEPELRVSTAALVLTLLLLPTLQQFQFAGGRINGDGVNYYVYTRSLAKDGDLDFTNEYTHYGLIDRGDIAVPTRTGLRRSIFAVGPGLLALPHFALGEAVARVQKSLGLDADLSGYGPSHRNAVALGNLLYGFAAMVLIYATLVRHFKNSTALLATLLVWGATFLHWYMVQQPTMSHAPSAFVAALVIWLWDRWRQPTLLQSAALGLLLGFSMCVRWQNGVLLLLPLVRLLPRRRADWVPAFQHAAVLGAGLAIGALPQLVAWKVIYGEYLLRYPPHGADFLRLDHPFLLETFFSSRHGLLSWTPVFWIGYLGFLPLWRRRPSLARVLIVPLLAMTYVNVCSGDWWAGGSFSNRRFDSLLPIFAFGFAAAIDVGRRWVATHPRYAAGLLVLPFLVWSLALAEATQRGFVPRDDTVSFGALTGAAARAAADTTGFPTTWPASWLFAQQTGLSPGRYDLIAGRYLFYRQNNLGGVVDLGNPNHAGLLEGFSAPERLGSDAARRIRGHGRVFVSLDVPEPLELRIRARAIDFPAAVNVLVNGRPVGSFVAEANEDIREARVPAPVAAWRRERNEIALETAGSVAISQIAFVRIR